VEGRSEELAGYAGRPGERLLEREAELATLGALLETARGGTGALAVVEGPPGIGKTGLLHTFVDLAHAAGFLILVAIGIELESEFAFGVVRQLLEPAIAGLEPDERAGVLAGAAATAAPLVDPTIEEPPPPQVPGDTFPMLHGLYWVCSNLSAARPVAIVVDDAHWADDQSLRWLHYLSSRVEGQPVCIVAAARSTRPEAPVALIEAIKSGPGARVIQPNPLSRPASRQLLARIFAAEPQSRFAGMAHETTGGNPFLLEALATSLAADGIPPDDDHADQLVAVRPEVVSRTMLARLASLAPDSRSVARAVAVLGDGTDLRNVAELAEIPEAKASAAADVLADVGLFDVGRPLRFAHPLIRATVYGDLQPAERSDQHRHAADVLIQTGAARSHVAAHLLAVEPQSDKRVVDVLREAAGDAMARGAPDAAATYLRRALEEPAMNGHRTAVLGELGLAEAALAHPDSETHIREAIDRTDSVVDRIPLVRALAFLLVQLGRPAEGTQVLRDAIEVVPGSDRELRMLLEADVLVVLTILMEGGPRQAAPLIRRYGTGLEGKNAGERALLATLAEWRCRTGDVTAEESVAMATRALGGGRLLAEAGAGSLHFVWALYALIFGDAFEEAESEVGPALEQARASGSLFVAGQVAAIAGLLALRRGNTADAEAKARDSLEFAVSIQAAAGAGAPTGPEEGPPPAGLVFTLAILIDALVERGDSAVARSELGRLGMLEGTTPVAVASFLLQSRGRMWLAEGEPARALADAHEAGDMAASWGARNPAYSGWRSLAALANLRLGNEREALALAEEEVELAEQFSARSSIGVALRARGLASGGDQGMADLIRAVGELAQSGARLEYARALAELGAALRRANRRSDSREPLRAAIEIARSCGAMPLAEHAHQELRATGARPRSLEFSGVAALTARERQIAELAAQGRSNPEIAQSLFVTRRTVETHLTSIYRKLEIGSRDDLARTLAAD
jgi:DNA-binding CsgD family transcriptional regulator